MLRTALLGAGLVLGLQATAVAAIGNLNEVTLGEHWYGPKRDMDDLKGRVVMVELWGFN